MNRIRWRIERLGLLIKDWTIMKKDVNEVMITFQSQDGLSCGDDIMWLKNIPFQSWYCVRNKEKDMCSSSTQDFVKSNQVKP